MGGSVISLYSEVKTIPVKWLWYPFIAVGKISLLQGDPGDGKSTMMLSLIAEISKGGNTPDGKPLGRPQRVLYQCSEDGVAGTIKPRLVASGADCNNIAFINEEVYGGLTLDDERLRQAIIEFKPRLVVIDPIQAYIAVCSADERFAASYSPERYHADRGDRKRRDLLDNQKLVRVRIIKTGQCQWRLPTKGRSITKLQFFTSNRILLAGYASNGDILLWELINELRQALD